MMLFLHPAVLAAANASASGDWSVVTRDDGPVHV
jgi:predicted lipoprotein with Yx(FWY)xxD motif